MRSFAIWYFPEENKKSTNKDIKVHINLWDNGKKNKEYNFDFGFLLEDIRNIEEMCLYIPFKVDKKQILDLGKIISNNKLVDAIFNENFTTTDGNPKRLHVNGNENKESFTIYALEINNQISLINTDAPGTILKINLKNIEVYDNEYRYYFRIRIKGNNSNISLIHDEIEDISVFNNQFINTEIIDFRLNDIRSCSEEIREEFNRGKKFKISTIHYLILRNASDILIHHGRKLSSRMLETDLWKNYIDGTNKNIIAYHIKSKSEKIPNEDGTIEIKYIEDFSELVRFQYKKGTTRIIFIYISVIILLGAFGGVLGNILSRLIGL